MKSTLLTELKMADRIISNALKIMTPQQKNQWSIANARDGVDGERITRENERNEAIKKEEAQIQARAMAAEDKPNYRD